MSAISFPPSGHSTQDDDHYYASSFDTSSSFQMNPLSAHPPRTPRTSILSSHSQVYGAPIYDPKEDEEEHSYSNGTANMDQEDEPLDALKNVRNEEVYRELFLLSNGRDKAFKLIQYSLKLYLLFHNSLTSTRLLKRPTRPPWEQTLLKRLNSTVSGLSFSRKTLLLFNWTSPLSHILAQQSVPFSTEHSVEKGKPAKQPFLYSLLQAPPTVLLELVHAMSDDVYTLSLLGMLGKRTGSRAARFSDWCWLLSTLAKLVENSVERQVLSNLQTQVESRMYKDSLSGATAKSQGTLSKVDQREISRLQQKDYWLQVVKAKLLMDLIFVSYDVFQLKWARELIKTCTGLAAAILSCAKLVDHHRVLLLKKA